MSKVGIYSIGFVEQNEENDGWVQQELQDEPAIRDQVVPVNPNLRKFKSIDQKTADLTEDLVMDENGRKYEEHLSFAVRKDTDIELARKYAGRPVVVYAWAVDGHIYKIGTKSYPAYLVTSDRYRGVDNREIALTVDYQSLTRLLQ